MTHNQLLQNPLQDEPLNQCLSSQKNAPKFSHEDHASVLPQVKFSQKPIALLRQATTTVKVIGCFISAYYLAYKNNAFNDPYTAHMPKVVKQVAFSLCRALDIEVILHGEMPTINALWTCNHISWADPIILARYVNTYFIAKFEVSKMPMIGSLAKAGGTLFIKRGSGDASKVSDQIAVFLNQKKSVIFFPEATTTDGKRVYFVHGKLLISAIETNTPVQPVVMCYQNAKGELDTLIPFIGEQTLIQNAMHVFSESGVKAHVMALDAIDPTGHTIETLRDELQCRMDLGLKALHQLVFSRT